MIATTPLCICTTRRVCGGKRGYESPPLCVSYTHKRRVFFGVKEVERVGDDVTIVSAVKNYA